jgi:hypothetical protein
MFAEFDGPGRKFHVGFLHPNENNLEDAMDRAADVTVMLFGIGESLEEVEILHLFVSFYASLFPLVLTACFR